MRAKPKILYLHGTSNSGKTTLARKFMELKNEPWINLSMDYFYDMFDKRYQTPEWPLYDRIVEGLHRSAAAWLELGTNVIIDAVLEKPEQIKDAAHLFQNKLAYLIKVSSPLQILEERENARGNTPPGLARYQYPLVYAGLPYDIEVDTSRSEPLSCATYLSRMLQESGPPHAFQEILWSERSPGVKLPAALAE